MRKVNGKVFSKVSPIVGAKIELVTGKEKDIIYTTYTTKDGEFNIDLDFIQSNKNLEIKVYGKDEDTPLVSSKIKTGSANGLKLRVKGASIKNYEPNKVHVKRLSGALIQSEKIKTIKLALGSLNPEININQSLSKIIGRCPLPEIAKINDLLDISWGVIDNIPDSKVKFRLILDYFKTKEGKFFESGFARSLRNQIQISHSSNTLILPFNLSSPQETFSRFPKKDCFISKDNFLSVGIATALVSKNALELFENFRYLENEFDELREIKGLFKDSIEVLSGAEPGNFIRRNISIYGECGPDDGPPRLPPLNDSPFENCDFDRINCIQEIIESFKQGSEAPHPYEIISITPENVCPGDIITISGTSFGAEGQVIFQHARGFGVIKTNAISWTDSEIRVEVPENSGSGEVSLSTLGQAKIICDRIIDVKRPGNSKPIIADTAYIKYLRINNEFIKSSCFAPGERITINWSSTHPNVKLHIRVPGRRTIVHDNLPSLGEVLYNLPNVNSPTKVNITAEVNSSCGKHINNHEFELNVKPSLLIEGIEFTQGIQKFSLDGTDNNSLRLISNKETIARVYISCDREGFNNDMVSVTGELFVEVDGYYEKLEPINGITPMNVSGTPFITALPRESIDRQETDHTLNFRIPAELCKGTKRIRARIFTDSICNDMISINSYFSQAWTENDSLRVRFVRIRGDHMNSNSARPSVNDCRFTILRGLDLIPTDLTDVGPAWLEEFNTNRDFTNSDDALGDLLDDLNGRHNCDWWESIWSWAGADCPDDDGARWVGLTTVFNRGMAKRPGNTCISAIYNATNSYGGDTDQILRVKTAHELAHNVGFKHVSVTGRERGELYDHPNGGDILEVAFDPYWNRTVPQNTTDFMGYDTNRWASADIWDRMINTNF